MSNLKIGLRFLLGAVYLVFGLNFFLHFFELPPPSEAMMEWGAGMAKMGYMMKLVKVTEVTCGALLILNLFVPLALVALVPITVNIFMVHTLVDMGGFPMALAILVIHVFLGFAYRANFKPLFKMKA